MEEKINGPKEAPAKQNNNLLAMLSHILALFFGWLPPLIILLVTKEEDIKNHCRMSLNWQLSFLIYAVISALLTFVVVGIFLLIALVVLDIVFCIMATIKASRWELWKYPLTIPFLKAK